MPPQSSMMSSVPVLPPQLARLSRHRQQRHLRQWHLHYSSSSCRPRPLPSPSSPLFSRRASFFASAPELADGRTITSQHYFRRFHIRHHQLAGGAGGGGGGGGPRAIVRPLHSSSTFQGTATTGVRLGTGSVEIHDDAHDDDEDVDDYVPIVIAGGGPTGLLLSSLLSSHGTPSLLYEARPANQLLAHPAAHFINLRTVEILRNCLPPAVSEKMWAEVPPVDQWDKFQFGHSVLGGDAGRIGSVTHGVRDGDGGGAGVISPCRVAHLAQNRFCRILLDEAERAAGTVDGADLHLDTRVVAVRENDGRERGCGGDDDGLESTTNVPKGQSRRGRLVVETLSPATTDGTRRRRRTGCDYVIAADGVRSSLREALGNGTTVAPETPAHDDRIRREDLDTIANFREQHLINVHFTTSPGLTRRLMESPNRLGMLHFVYNESVVCAFVVHDLAKGEWVCQIPYFPPYQTLEVDFSWDRCRRLILAGLGVDYEDDEPKDGGGIEIKSVQPWCMTCWVAPTYLLRLGNDDGGGGIVVGAAAGDAAHAFPPAGGFGMNTGLQDAHNLAWRLSLLVRRHRHREGGAAASSAAAEAQAREAEAEAALGKYQDDRRPVALSNAALSARNYRRTLDLASALGLDAAHPDLLIKAMNSSPVNLLPMDLRRDAFRALLGTATMPLAALRDGGNLYGNVLRERAGGLLRRGEGLPLLFPRYELGFAHRGGDIDGMGHDDDHDDDDTASYVPRLGVGLRLPHCEVEVLSPSPEEPEQRGGSKDGWPNLVFLDREEDAGDDERVQLTGQSTGRPTRRRRMISTTDLPPQLSRGEKPCPPCFALITPPGLCHVVAASDTAARIGVDAEVDVEVVQVLPAPHRSVDGGDRQRRRHRHHLVVRDVDGSWGDLLADLASRRRRPPAPRGSESLDDGGGAASGEDNAASACFVLVRPDGHVGDIIWWARSEEVMMTEEERHANNADGVPSSSHLSTFLHKRIVEGLSTSLGYSI